MAEPLVAHLHYLFFASALTALATGLLHLILLQGRRLRRRSHRRRDRQRTALHPHRARTAGAHAADGGAHGTRHRALSPISGNFPAPRSPGGSAAGDALRVHVERVQRLARRHEEPDALDPAEAEIGAALREQDAADELTGRVEDRHAVVSLAAAPAAPEIAIRVAAHTVRDPLSGVDEHAPVGELRSPVDHAEDPDLARRGPADDDVQPGLVG